MTSPLLFCLLFILGIADPLRGVHPSVSSHYQGNTFKCLDGSKTISISAVNDDYCDCNDASDEPGTSACNGKYYCTNKGHVPEIIYSSRVNDGICDCCDGSDEYLSNYCHNTCEKAKEERKKQTLLEIEEHEFGIEYTKQQLLVYYKEVQQKQSIIAEMKDKKSVFTAQLEEHKSQKENLQNSLNTLTEEIKLQLSPEVDLELIKKLEEEAAEKQNSAENQAPAENSAENQNTEENIQDSGEIPGDSQEATPPEEKSELEIQEQEEAHKQKLRNEIMDAKLNTVDQLNNFKDEIKNVDNVINDINKEIEQLDRQIQEHEDFISFDFGPSACYSYLNGQTYTINSGEYTYTLKVFKDVTQGHTRVGSWGSWLDNYSKMKYENGDHCWGGPHRSLVVSLVCGKQTEMLEVKEPFRCEYTVIMKTPGACKPETLEQLRNQ